MVNANILTFDIENSPMKTHVYEFFNQNIGLSQLWKDWYILSYAAKWLGEDDIIFDSIYEYDLFDEDPENDYAVLLSLWNLLDKADIVIGHNVKKFDLAKVRARMLIHDIPPFSPVQVIDTLHIARDQFKFSSNKLDYIAGALGLEPKVKHDGMPMWVRCMAGDPESWEVMEEYNRHDVELTEEVYLRLRPWARTHPNMGLYVDDVPGGAMVCTRCGGTNLTKDGTCTTKTDMSRFQRYHCPDCGYYPRGRKNLQDRTRLTANVR